MLIFYFFVRSTSLCVCFFRFVTNSLSLKTSVPSTENDPKDLCLCIIN